MTKRKKKAKPGKKPRYRSFLSSFVWKKLRVDVLNRDGCECCLCGSKDKLAVHHLLYRKFFKDFWTEPLNLVVVCQRCHCSIHKGVGNFRLLEYLRTGRPEQYAFVTENL